MKIRWFAIWVIVSLTIVPSLTGAMPQETITAVCRQPNSFNVVPIAIDVPTGTGTVLQPAVIAADAEGHVSATLDASGKLIAGFTARQSASGPFAEALLTIDTATGVVQSATSPLAGVAFSGNGIVWRQQAPQSEVFVSQPGGAGATIVTRVDASTGAVIPVSPTQDSFTVPFGGLRRPYDTPAQTFFELSPQQGNVANLLQPCSMRGALVSVPQQIARLDLTTNQVTAVPLQVPEAFCVRAPGLVFGVVYALAERGGAQLVTLNPDDGSVNYLGATVDRSVWRMATASPYVYSFTTQSLYALNDAQTKLLRFDLNSGIATFVNVALPASCGTVMSFAGVSP